MSQPKQIDSLEISEDYSFQLKEWKAERVGWILMAGVILVALIGLFGEGPISDVTRSGPGGFQIEYSRFDRQMSPSELIVQIPAEAVQEGQARFWIDRPYMEKVQVEDISPEPESVEVSTDRMIYTVQVANPSQPVTVKFDFQHQSSGLVRSQAGIEGGDSISFSQFVFP